MVSVFPCFLYIVSVSLVFLIWLCCPNIWASRPLLWIGRCYGLLRTLYCPNNPYCDVTMIRPLLFHGIRVDVNETPDNALTTRMHGDYRLSIDKFFFWFNAIWYTFLGNNPIYIEGRNCRLSTVPGLFNKCLLALGHLIEVVAWLAMPCARGWAILW